MKLNLKKAVVDFLEASPGQKFTARMIARWILENHRIACEAKKLRSAVINDDTELLQQIVAEIGANRPAIQKLRPEIMTTETRPKQYYYSTTIADNDEINRLPDVVPSNNTEITELMECDLYPKLCKYLWTEFKLYMKRIDERKSSNRFGPDGNKWLFPDLVGMENLSEEWEEGVRSCVNEYGDRRVRLWLFEVKRKITRKDVRRFWFQAVSNSSWANFGYLVAADIEESGDVMKELRMLSAAHGIGLIQLDPENPDESIILIPSRERDSIDWDACSRLAKENSDFRFFIKLIRQFHQTGDSQSRYWDTHIEEE